MPFRRKSADPIDRAIDDLDRQIATLQRQLREMGTQPSGAAEPHRPEPPMQTFTKLVKGVLAPPRRSPDSLARSREDLFDVKAEPLKELEAEPIAFANKPEPDLFTHAPGAALETAQVVPPHEKLAHYLGAGSIKSYKPLKHVQRKIRNRFFMWLGLSFVALWIIWFVIR
ncbi:MAG TPA: hypothetical protein VL486_08705 [Verrucomicrobiae bacterium]|nr:hypothetical protein [Verrucomicrobiae bacterium]